MDKVLNVYKRKDRDNEAGSRLVQVERWHVRNLNAENKIQNTFVLIKNIDVEGEKKQQCLLCMKPVDAAGMKPNMLQRLVHTEYFGKHIFSLGKPNQCNKKQIFAKITTVTSKSWRAPFEVAHRIAKCKKSLLELEEVYCLLLLI
jgi:hypothetical protein